MSPEYYYNFPHSFSWGECTSLFRNPVAYSATKTEIMMELRRIEAELNATTQRFRSERQQEIDILTTKYEAEAGVSAAPNTESKGARLC